jgi:hypothetical protein
LVVVFLFAEKWETNIKSKRTQGKADESKLLLQTPSKTRSGKAYSPSWK